MTEITTVGMISWWIVWRDKCATILPGEIVAWGGLEGMLLIARAWIPAEGRFLFLVADQTICN